MNKINGPKGSDQDFSDEETWSLDYTIACFALPRLKRFKEIKKAYPHDMTIEQWDEILDKMIFSLEDIIKEVEGEFPDGDSKQLVNHYSNRQEGLSLFGKYFDHLWW